MTNQSSARRCPLVLIGRGGVVTKGDYENFKLSSPVVPELPAASVSWWEAYAVPSREPFARRSATATPDLPSRYEIRTWLSYDVLSDVMGHVRLVLRSLSSSQGAIA